MELHELLRQCQPQSGPLNLVRIIRADLAELFKYFWLVFGRDPDPGIADGDFYCPVHPPGIDPDSAAFGRELHRVGQQVQEYLLDLALIPDIFAKPFVNVEINRDAVLYLRAPRLFETLLQSKADGSHLKTLTRLAKIQLLILDDLFLTALADPARNDLLEIIEDRHQKAPTVITSQCPIKNWHHIIAEPTVADAILDRLLHHCYKIELKGESIRKSKK